jgi:hypothetical protein
MTGEALLSPDQFVKILIARLTARIEAKAGNLVQAIAPDRKSICDQSQLSTLLV